MGWECAFENKREWGRWLQFVHIITRSLFNENRNEHNRNISYSIRNAT